MQSLSHAADSYDDDGYAVCCDCVLSVMRIVGSVLLWVIYVFRRVDVVCWWLLCTQLQI